MIIIGRKYFAKLTIFTIIIQITLSKSFQINEPLNESKLRIARSLNKPSECTISKDSLIDLKNEIDDILANATSSNDKKTCTLDLNDPDNCTEITNVIQCGIQNLKNELVSASSSYSDSIEEIIRWKNAYGNLINKYEDQKEILLDKNNKQGTNNSNPQLEKLQTDFLRLDEALNTSFGNLQAIKIDLCVSEILLGKTEEALRHFKELKSISISQIIKQSYNSKNNHDELKNFESIIDFIKLQSTVDNEIIAYETLYKEMDSKKDLNSLKIILLENGIRNSLAKDNLTSVYSNVDIYSNKIKDLWVDIILYNRKDTKLESFAKNYSNYFSDILYELVEKAFKENTSKFDNIINFIRDLPYLEQNIIGYKSLFEEMQNQDVLNGILKLAYFIKKSMEMKIFSDIDENYKIMFINLKSSIPSWARKIIWDGDKCKLKNHRWDQYLYADGNHFYGSNRRHVFTWQNGKPESVMDAESQWKFETRDQGDSFTIKNVGWNEYLYAASNPFAFDKDRRSVFTWGTQESVLQSYWKIIPTDAENCVSLQNTYHKEYLYADGGIQWDSSRRRVFTWRVGQPEGVMIQESEWNLECEYLYMEGESEKELK
ncbi:uncharacterized protein LOC123300942 [Chrysoperla carnea]|uniref:uncharacterized protein LOC123300942 n=1 Tax=Chrysoperla carnea TaxID=189513 RepID=UPI001D063045|nr:uncharacterized protein LOC123300942 [Chrysoperla carnea]XP_044739556.1 uncharacterized protein LOC123300942 [Chrysoperla carnea]